MRRNLGTPIEVAWDYRDFSPFAAVLLDLDGTIFHEDQALPGAVELVRLGVPAMKGISLVAPRLPAVMVQPMEQVGWVALALGASLLSWLLSRRLAGRSGLL